jgi:hypothetical protein
MCIMFVKEFGVEMPTKDVMRRCWRNNPDGGGYAYLTKKDEWHVRKGFDTFDKFMEALDAENFQPEHTAIVHFRVGTSGKMVGGVKWANWGIPHMDCTHPFPISPVPEELFAHEYTTPNIAFHNGTIGKGEKDLSDSQVGVRDFAVPLYPYLEDPKIRDLMYDLLDAVPTGSRWFFGRGSNYEMAGDWLYEEETKLWYSNDGYLPEEAWWKKHKKIRPSARAAYQEQPVGMGWWAGAEPIAEGNTSEILDVVNIWEGRKSYEFMSGSVWDWHKFMDLVDTLGNVAVPTKPDNVVDMTKPKDEVEEVWDTNNNVIGLVDRDGNIIWEDDPSKDVIFDETVDDDAPSDTFECPNCYNNLTVNDLNDYNECCWCFKEVKFPVVAVGRPEEEPCPNCGDDKSIIPSTFDIGDSECTRCGAIFVDTLSGFDSILTWNEDTRAEHQHLLDMMTGANTDAGRAISGTK